MRSSKFETQLSEGESKPDCCPWTLFFNRLPSTATSRWRLCFELAHPRQFRCYPWNSRWLLFYCSSTSQSNYSYERRGTVNTRIIGSRLVLVSLLLQRSPACSSFFYFIFWCIAISEVQLFLTVNSISETGFSLIRWRRWNVSLNGLPTSSVLVGFSNRFHGSPGRTVGCARGDGFC